MAVELYRQGDRSPVGPGMASRGIFGTADGPRAAPVFMEWELTGAEWVDQHPHDEFNFVLEGELHVESDGEVVVARAGDFVRVRADSVGRYSAPEHARMLAVYDHNPDGAATTIIGLRRLDADATDG